MLHQIRRDHQNLRRGTDARPHLRRERTTETPQGILAGKKLTPRIEASPNTFSTRETIITPLTTAAPTGSTLEWKDVLRQAETLFNRGEYEQALVWFHRGSRLKPKAREFQNGIARCERSIHNRCTLPQNSAYSFGRESDNSSAGDSPPRSRASTRNTHVSSVQHTTRSLPTPQVSMRSGGTTATPVSPWVTESEQDADTSQDRKHILKLKRDRMYLKDLLKEMDTNITRRPDVQNIVEEGLKYLDTRTKFWKQNLPVHALRNLQTRSFQFPVPSMSVRDESSLPSVMGNMTGRTGAHSSNINHYVLREVFKVHQDFLDERYKECIGRAERCIQTIQIHKASEIGRKYELVANMYALKGNSHFQLDQYKEALMCYHRDLEISKEKDMIESKSRALENIGRVYARIGEFDKAVNVWKEKSALCRSESERAWLYHEIGYCYLSKREYSRAKQFGEMAYASAENTGDLIWQLNASTLIAQAEARKKELQNAFDTFRYAQDLARMIGDREEQMNIEEAMGSIRLAINEEREERRRKQVESAKSPKPPHKQQLPNGLVLTEEDLLYDDDVYRDSPEFTEDQTMRTQFQAPKGGKIRRLLHGTSDHSPNRGRKLPSPSSNVDNFTLAGGPVPFSLRGHRDYKSEKKGDTETLLAALDPPDDLSKKDTSIKGILKNSAGKGRSINIWSDLEAPVEHEEGNINLLPAIARSNTQLGLVQPDLGGRGPNPPPSANNDPEQRQQSKSVRFKEENELFRLPDIPPGPPSEHSTVASEAEDHTLPHPRMVRAMLEAEGYFIGKYA